MSIEEEAKRYAEMLKGVDLGKDPQTRTNEIIIGLLTEIRDKLDILIEKK